MMNKNKAIAFSLVSILLLGINILLNAAPALAHHATGGQLPTNFAEGFISGLAHPIIGIDHLAFVMAIGLLAALSQGIGIVMPAAFVTATALGAVIHLQGINLPAPELIIAISVLAIGIFLARENQTNLKLLTGLSAIAGIFHGYAYAESIFGAGMTTIGAYLLGFSLIQLIISAIVFYVGRAWFKTSVLKSPVKLPLSLRFAGFTICGVGFSFLGNVIIGRLFPV